MPTGFEAWAAAFSVAPPRRSRDSRPETAAAFAELLRLSQATPAEFAEVLGRAVGRQITGDMFESYCDPLGPKPPAHHLVAAARLVERFLPGAGVAVLGGLAG